MKDSFKEIFGDKKRVMFVMSHPDDCEVYAGSLIARLVKEGIEVRLVKMTSGNKGSRQNATTEEELMNMREEEDNLAAKILGINSENNVHLRIGDGEIEDTHENIEKIVREIRFFKPDLIVTHNPEDVIIKFDSENSWINHRDHKNTGLVTTYAAYPFSRDILFYPEHLTDTKLSSHSVTEFLYVDYYNHPDEVFFDVTNFIDQRIKAHSAHASQITLEDAKGSAEFFTNNADGNNYERFRHVIID